MYRSRQLEIIHLNIHERYLELPQVCLKNQKVSRHSESRFHTCNTLTHFNGNTTEIGIPPLISFHKDLKQQCPCFWLLEQLKIHVIFGFSGMNIHSARFQRNEIIAEQFAILLEKGVILSHSCRHKHR